MERLTKRSLYFPAPYAIEIREEKMAASAPPGTLLVESTLSAVSPGTELLIYRGEFPRDLPLDDTIPSLSGPFRYPTTYGYAVVGRVIDAADGLGEWQGKRVFAFHPHESHFVALPDEVVLLPDRVSVEEAVMLPFVETAVSFLLDGAPLVGETVAVFGQGCVGLLTTALLAKMPLGCLITLDSHVTRREASLALGAQASFDPDGRASGELMKAFCEGGSLDGADLVYELSGNPAALNQAIGVAGFNGRIIIGSWYGAKQAGLDLGSRFHRKRIRVISSQVSSMTPGLAPRAWSKSRRLGFSMKMLESISPSSLITHSFAVESAGKAYELLDGNPGEAIGVVFTY